MTETTAFAVPPDQLLSFLFSAASRLTSTEQVEPSPSALDFMSQVTSADIPLTELNPDQRLAVTAFLMEYFPQAVLADYGLSSPD